jgi:subtilisin family serine protease
MLKKSTLCLFALLMLLPGTAQASNYALLPLNDGDRLHSGELAKEDRDLIESRLGDGLVLTDRPGVIPRGTELVKASPMKLLEDPDVWLQWPMVEHGYRDLYPAGWTGAGTVVAVVDTGSVASHQDLYSLVPGYNTLENNTNTIDGHGHGTHVSSIIASPVNGVGIQGVAPGATIMPLKALSDGGSGTNLSVAQAIHWATDNGADIINLSLGGSSDDGRVLGDALDYAVSRGVAVVCASGNSRDITPHELAYPGRYESCLTTGAAAGDYGLMNFSQGGPQLDVTAPGSGRFISITGGYTSGAGTSYAAPHVSALMALLISTKGGLTPTQAEARLESTARDQGPAGWDQDYGHGVVDPLAAFALSPAPDPETGSDDEDKDPYTHDDPVFDCADNTVTVASGSKASIGITCGPYTITYASSLRGTFSTVGGAYYTAPRNWQGTETLRYTMGADHIETITIRVVPRASSLRVGYRKGGCLRINIGRSLSWDRTRANVAVYQGTRRVRFVRNVTLSTCVKSLPKNNRLTRIIVTKPAAPGLKAATKTIRFRA